MSTGKFIIVLQDKKEKTLFRYLIESEEYISATIKAMQKAEYNLWPIDDVNCPETVEETAIPKLDKYRLVAVYPAFGDLTSLLPDEMFWADFEVFE